MAAPPPVRPRSVSVAGAAPGSSAAADKQNAQGNYTFKVLRMNRPSFAMPGLPLYCSASDSASLGTDALVLPKAFGTIFLGEVQAPPARLLRPFTPSYSRCSMATSHFATTGCRISRAVWSAALILPSACISFLRPLAQLKAEINCGARRTQLMDNSSQPIAVLPAKST